MIDLKKILKSHPNCLSSRASFKSVLMDSYPNEKRTVNILTIMFECGIVQKIKSKSVLGENDFQSLIVQLENNYGIIPQYSSDCVFVWADALDINVQANRKPVTKTVTHETIDHAPIVEQVVVDGVKSDYETSLENGSLTIKKFIGFDEQEIIIPNHIDGVPVKTIGENAFAKCTGIEKVVVSEGITEICNGAFCDCSALKDVVLPTTLIALGPISEKTKSSNSPSTTSSYNGAFANTAIEDIYLPVNLQVLGGKSFLGCRNLKKINLPNNIQVIHESCFEDCINLREVTFPNNLRIIGSSAFCNSGLTKIDIPISVIKIKKSAFSHCKQLSRVMLHEGLETIEDSVFENCKGICTITIPKSVTSIGEQLFDITGWYQPHDRRRNGWITRNKNSNLVICCYAGSCGLDYARKEGYQIKNAAK